MELKTKLKSGDEVVVVSGSQKGKRGKIMHIDRKKKRVYVQGVNRIKRFQRPTQENPKGGVIEVEASMHISNVMFYDSKTKKGVRLGRRADKDKKVRVSRPEGKEV
ncbi:MAG: 50S ribosomal protein L24 [Spirochaetia bacterium]|nr:50S ribosomal protein L24 [Spirochaetia bacterium]